eukprot:1151450-Pelagomonas_calceolata.AAC.7
MPSISAAYAAQHSICWTALDAAQDSLLLQQPALNCRCFDMPHKTHLVVVELRAGAAGHVGRKHSDTHQPHAAYAALWHAAVFGRRPPA